MDDRRAALGLALLALSGAGVRYALAPARPPATAPGDVQLVAVDTPPGRDLRETARAAARVARAARPVWQSRAFRQCAGGGASVARRGAPLRDLFGGDAPRALTPLRRDVCYTVQFQRVAYGDRSDYQRQAGRDPPSGRPDLPGAAQESAARAEEHGDAPGLHPGEAGLCRGDRDLQDAGPAVPHARRRPLPLRG